MPAAPRPSPYDASVSIIQEFSIDIHFRRIIHTNTFPYTTDGIPHSAGEALGGAADGVGYAAEDAAWAAGLLLVGGHGWVACLIDWLDEVVDVMLDLMVIWIGVGMFWQLL